MILYIIVQSLIKSFNRLKQSSTAHGFSDASSIPKYLWYRLTRDENTLREPVKRGLLAPIANTTAIDTDIIPLDVNKITQGSIGDCYVIASFKAIAGTSRGKKWLLTNIKEVTEGYLVKIYPNTGLFWPFTRRKAKVVFVDQVCTDGAKYKNGQGIVSIYEAALAKHWGGYKTYLGLRGIDTPGWPSTGMSILTGKTPAYYPLIVLPVPCKERALAKVKSKIAKGIPTVASTLMNPFGKKWVASDGTTIASGHVYRVVSINSDGVVVQNTWKNDKNSANGKDPFFVSKRVFFKYFVMMNTAV